MRLILAVWAAKLSSLIGKIIGKKSTATPGVLALKICPELIKRLKKNVSGKIIVTCGTNGKTTTNNLIYEALKKSGHRVLCNDLGANMLGGVATTFAMGCNIFGKLKADYACLEVDEASTVKVFDHLTPDYMVSVVGLEAIHYGPSVRTRTPLFCYARLDSNATYSGGAKGSRTSRYH